ncbi:glutamate-1-semialdehyde 2,1-aminomutase [Terrisporobacter glycolicus]|uniref:Glutamate-1-semialdehyde 2,1-aminomutase n=1 Tax=Terrisporobacter glycolicus ATCC 14880 = DSM 1288 TaxID=1121315 RepID=A0ABZ2ES66_9FIRM|nr:glutamate-1-semialdehyde 2,1-aminomutase [Terrisporobacter glycolicus]
MKHTKSEELYKEAVKYIPGGVNSPVRSFNSVGISPIFAKKAHGSKITDVDDNEYIDYICSWGPLMLGHSNEEISKGIGEMIASGTSFGLATEIEVEMAKLIVDAYPAIDQVRMVNSGTEATMSALRVARGFTKRNKIVKFEGCYHGHSDGLLVKSGSGTITFGVPTSPGVPEDIVKNTLVCKYNDIEDVKRVFEENGEDIAAIIVETIGGNMGIVPGKQEFIEFLREICDEYKTVLIFDEVITGFRLSYNSSLEYFGVKPDMVCFGKIIGAGMPVGAYGGKKEIMEVVSPIGPVYQAGTLSGNPLAMYLGKRNLEVLRDNPRIYEELNEKADKLEQGIKDNLKKLNLNYTVNRAGSLVCLFFKEGSVENYDDAIESNIEKYNKYFKEMLDRGVLIGPSQFEAMFLSYAHSNEDIEYTIKCNYESLRAIHNL